MFKIDANLLKLAKYLYDKASSLNVKISTAESCTGGLLAGCITSISGASKIFDYGFVTYSNEAKTSLLSVPSKIIDKFGAVSPQTAEAMAIGALKVSKSDIALSITGVAGGGTIYKPNGQVYFAIATPQSLISYFENFKGTRQAIRYQACSKALKIIHCELGSTHITV